MTVPPTAILTVSGLNDAPAPLAVMVALALNELTVASVVAVRVVVPDVNDARISAEPGASAITRPVGDTDTAVPLIRSNVGVPNPVMAAPFWSRGVAVICTVSRNTRSGLDGEIVSDVNTAVGGG